jgi:hypothetical protein
MYEQKRGAHRVLLRKPEGKRPLGKPRCIWDNDIKTGLQEVGWEAWTGWIHLVQDKGGWQPLRNMVQKSTSRFHKM